MSNFPTNIPWGLQTDEQRAMVLAWRDEQRRQEDAARNAASGGFEQAQLCAILNGTDAAHAVVGRLETPNEHSPFPAAFCFSNGAQFWQATAAPDRCVTGERIRHRWNVMGPFTQAAINGTQAAW